MRSVLSSLQDEEPKVSVFSYTTVTIVEDTVLRFASCVNRLSISFPATDGSFPQLLLVKKESALTKTEESS